MPVRTTKLCIPGYALAYPGYRYGAMAMPASPGKFAILSWVKTQRHVFALAAAAKITFFESKKKIPLKTRRWGTLAGILISG